MKGVKYFVVFTAVTAHSSLRSGEKRHRWYYHGCLDEKWYHFTMELARIKLLCLLLVVYVAVSIAQRRTTPRPTAQELLNWNPPDGVKYKYPYYLSGFDNEGSPVYVWEYGRWDFRSAAEAGKNATEELRRVIAQMALRWKEDGIQSPDKGGTVVIADSRGFNLRQASHVGVVRFLIGAFKNFAEINRTPGGIKRLYNVNTNYLIRHLFRISRRYLGSVANVTELHNDSEGEQWRRILLRTIPQDQLPEEYGGLPDHRPVRIYG